MDKKVLASTEKILDYWYTCEFLTQDSFPKFNEIQTRVKKIKKKVAENAEIKERHILNTISLNKEDDLYDKVLQETKSCGMSRWGNFTVYIGKIKREACIENIAAYLSEQDERPEHSKDEIALASLQLTQEGVYVKDSFSLSPIVWSMNQLSAGGKNFSDNLSIKKYKEAVEIIECALLLGKESVETASENESTNEGEPCFSEFSPNAVTMKKLNEIYEWIVQHFVWESGIEVLSDQKEWIYGEIYTISFSMFKNQDEEKGHEDDNYAGLSHEFYLRDLKMVLDNVRSGAFDQPDCMLRDLISYIDAPENEASSKGARGRFDVMKPETISDYEKWAGNVLHVQNSPMGKWPSKYMPAFMQQIAVNMISGKRTSDICQESSKVFSVNGPPGTGKTTMLKEIVANNIVERAKLLAAYERADDAFEKNVFLHGEKLHNNYSKFVPYWYRLKDDNVNDFSMLVTSNNNAAVENISKELPRDLVTSALSGEDKEVLFTKKPEKKGEFADIYFTEYTKELLGVQDAWGMIAVPLGKKSNVSDFYRKVLVPLLADFYQRNDQIEQRHENYMIAKRNFLQQLHVVEQMQNELSAHCDIYLEQLAAKENNKKIHAELEDKILLAGKEIDKIAAQIEGMKLQIQQAKKALEELRWEKENAGQIYETQCSQYKSGYEEVITLREQVITVQNSVGVLTRIFKPQKYKDACELAEVYRKEADRKEEELRFFETVIQKSKEIQVRVDSKLQKAEERYAGFVREEKTLCSRRENLNKQIVQYRASIQEDDKHLQNILKNYERTVFEYGQKPEEERGLILNKEFILELLSEDEEVSTRAQVSNPWFSQKYNIEREKLFYCAMKLNKEFILSSKCCRANLNTLSHYWGLKSGDENEKIVFHREDRERIAPALYQTLFLLVPVISSTFASVGNLLKDVKDPGTVGMLIVDEAGQAPPQMAVGALYRSKQAVIVGDPKQVEPVVTDDLELLKKAFTEKEYRAYRDKSLSVQRCADILNRVGTYYDNGSDQKEWVGCPLVVHRRCISPMYDISNQISYNNIMKLQTAMPDETKVKGFVYEKSQWINVSGKENGNKDHFVTAQGKKVCDILEIAFSKSDYPDIYIISPFTSVVSGLRRYIQKYCKERPDSALVKGTEEWIYTNIGTVHTFQGKEANEVIFLLGCDTSKGSEGAVRWVNRNIVNVAVTRAKYRLYVIGDAQVWEKSECVGTAKAIMDTYALVRIDKLLQKDIRTDEEAVKKMEMLTTLAVQIPSVTSFPVDEIVGDSGEKEYDIKTNHWLKELDMSGFLNTELTEEQLRKFGFKTYDDLEEFSAPVRKNLIFGMKLYYLMSGVYEADASGNLDASCCAILFCKAIELHMRDCFMDGMKHIFPKTEVRGSGNGRNKTCLKEAHEKEFTLGLFAYIIGRNTAQLGKLMQEMNEKKYDQNWWKSFHAKLRDCTNGRNCCCHAGLFKWSGLQQLLYDIFMEDRADEGRNPGISGLLFESRVGKKLSQ